MKPTVVKWINGLIIFRFVCIAFILICGGIAIFTMPEDGFFKGISEGMGLQEVGDPYFTFGQLFGWMLLPLIFSLGTYFSLKKRKKVLFFVFVALDILGAIGSSGLPIIPVIILILGLQKSTQSYLEEGKKEILT